MQWGFGGVLLVGMAVLLRRALQLGGKPAPVIRGLPPLGSRREAIYEPIALELETRTAILGVSLNDAIEERDSGNDEIAWRLVRLATDEWHRVAEIDGVLLGTITKHLPAARVPLPVRNMVAQRFRSQTMIDYVRMHEILDQLVFRFKFRFHLHIRVLRRAVETLTAHFRGTQRLGEQTADRSAALWSQLDLDFHDFDLITKETLLALRAFLLYLPEDALQDFAADLSPILARGVRSTHARTATLV